MSQPTIQPEVATIEPQSREVYGRTILTDQHYALPKDQEELNRLDIQHEALKLFIGGLYVVPELVESALMSKDETVARVLDAGMGSGAWAIDMAKEHPECEVIGMDLALPALQISQPRNLRFQVADFNKPLDLETASVNFVHARAIDNGISQYPEWLGQVSRVLCPKGIYLVSKGRAALVHPNGEKFRTVPIGEEGYTGVQNLFSVMHEINQAVWGGMHQYESWLIWMRENGNFENIGSTDTLFPVGAWQTGLDEETQIGAELMRQNTLRLIPAIKPAAIAAGHDENIVDRWIADATLEISELRINALVRWSWAWAVRSDNVWKPYDSRVM